MNRTEQLAFTLSETDTPSSANQPRVHDSDATTPTQRPRREMRSDDPKTRELVDAVAIARRIGMSKPWVTAAARRGLIPHYRLPNVMGEGDRCPLRFDLAEVERWLEQARGSLRRP